MLKRQKPTEAPARFKANSMNSLFESVRTVCEKRDHLHEQPSSFGGGGGFMPKLGGGTFGSPVTTNPTGKAGKKSSYSGKNDPTAYMRYGLGLPALAYTIGGGMEAVDKFFPEVGAKGAEMALLSGLGLLGTIGKAGGFNFGGTPTPNKFRGTGGFKGI
jgi:hypothetical protein